jgi:hypothetical protein
MSELPFVLEVPQPLAHLIVTGQVDCWPGRFEKPPQAACGERIAVAAKGFSPALLHRLEEAQYFDYPVAKTGQVPTRTWWRKDRSRTRGKWRTIRGGREWVPDTQAFLSEAFSVVLPTSGVIGTTCLDGWLQMEGRQVLAQYRPPGEHAAMRLSKIAAGPFCWVLRRSNQESRQGRVVIP